MPSTHSPQRRSAEMPSRETFETLIDVLETRATCQGSDLAYEFHGHSAPAERTPARVSYGELLSQSLAVAAELQRRELQRTPVLLLFRPGLDFIRAYCGCLLAGAVGTPLRPAVTPNEQRQAVAIAADSRARLVLTSRSFAEPLRALFKAVPSLSQIELLALEEIGLDGAGRWLRPDVGRDDLALIQYTSGSTGRPKGVMVSHANLLDNEATIAEAFRHDRSTIVAGWLPMFHDMGLIGNVLQPLYAGVPSVLMDPLSFVQKPLRWLQLISSARATTSGGPNFAYELCLRRVRDQDKAGLDLSSWSLAFSGAEPVRMDTMRRFAEAFAPAGFRREAFYPCYGLAECTLFVSGIERDAPATCITLDRDGLTRNEAIDSSAGREQAVEVVCCGSGRGAQEIRIVDPETGAPRGEGEIGEIWLRGPSAARGYLHQPELSRELFSAHISGEDGEPYLRTGDLGLVRGAQLYVSGRLKDLIIVRGRNHYPQDVETSIEGAHPSFRVGCTVAFAVDVEGAESLVVVQEVEPDRLSDEEVPALLEAARAIIAREHGLQLHDLLLTRPRSVPKTSSGKPQRRLCKTLYEGGELKRIKAPSQEHGR